MGDPFAKGRCQWCNREEGHSDYCKTMYGTPTKGEIESGGQHAGTACVNCRPAFKAMHEANAKARALEARNAELEAQNASHLATLKHIATAAHMYGIECHCGACYARQALQSAQRGTEGE